MTLDSASLLLSRSVVDGINVGVFTLDAELKVLQWNRFMEVNSGVTASSSIGKNLFDVFPDLPRAWFERKVRNVFLLKNYSFISWRQRAYLFPFPHNRPITGGVSHMHQDCTLVPMLDERGDVAAVCITLVDATDAYLLQRQTEEGATLLRDAMAELERISELDGLTGIYNRRTLEKRLANEFSRFKRYSTAFSILMFDLDHFKRVNDRYGHLGGDEVLRTVARRLGRSLRDTDTFGRYGGEEFMILLPSTSSTHALTLAERLRRAVADEPVTCGDASIAATISVGVGEATADMTLATDLVHRADGMLYACKAAGRNCVRAYGHRGETEESAHRATALSAAPAR